ncbi:hypothetical protein LUZ61_006495 [Rhynchospora tenuis]|uniref:Uncharacterized protein n=1 Tax=Rhynchospora tenuis TaxID=198213 RepID=A0AAD6EVQ2_9POAL|nr:hypothetical protein LUZ61_006495 [Rhynchospora tenuis]
MSSPPHALVLPWPEQGHIIPLMHLSHFLADNGFKITFVNTEDRHDRIVSAGAHADQFHMITIPDGLGPEESRLGPRLVDVIEYDMPSQLENLIQKINEEGSVKITFLIADGGMGWAVEVAERLGLRSVVFWPAPATFLATLLSIPKLRGAGVIDKNVGPLPLGKATKATGHFWSDDPTCIDWLDQQPVNSVVYVAFGSIATLDQNQLEEFAFALDSCQMRFLWVTRPDQTIGEHHDFLNQFRESINRRGKGKIVNWCNQEKVLAHHPSYVLCHIVAGTLPWMV